MTPTELKNLAINDQNTESIVRNLVKHPIFFEFHDGVVEAVTADTVHVFLAALLAAQMNLDKTEENRVLTMGIVGLLDCEDIARQCRDLIWLQIQGED